MINNLESYNKARLIELVKTQIEEYQKLEKNLGLIKLGIEQQHKQLISCETALDERNNKVSLQASRIAELEKDNADLQECFDTCYAELEATRVAHDELEKERNELNGKNTCLNNQAKSIRHAHTNLVQNDDFEESIFKCYYRVPVEEFNKLTEVILSSKGFGGNQQAKQLREGVNHE